MKAIGKRATDVFLALIEGLDRPGRSRKVDNARGSFMAVHVERLSLDPEVYSITHYFISNGDLVPDPDVEFIVTRTRVSGREVVGVYPSAIDQGPLGYRRYAEPLPGGRARPLARGQEGLASFCNTWMANVADQQSLSRRGVPAPEEDEE